MSHVWASKGLRGNGQDLVGLSRSLAEPESGRCGALNGLTFQSTPMVFSSSTADSGSPGTRGTRAARRKPRSRRCSAGTEARLKLTTACASAEPPRMGFLLKKIIKKNLCDSAVYFKIVSAGI